jgi:succinate dehydrogenase/fumarate reductase flavoprotein subunit
MNAPAAAFYREHGVDLSSQMLEIALCVQHNNGGLAIDDHWQTSLRGFYVVGEAAASHGVYRPGGSALNAGQVGATRAAEHIIKSRTLPDARAFAPLLARALDDALALKANAETTGQTDVSDLLNQAQRAMDENAGPFRSERNLEALLDGIARRRAALATQARASGTASLAMLFRLRDMLLCQQLYAGAMLDYLRRGGRSRGSALYTDAGGTRPYATLPERFTCRTDDGALAGRVQEAVWDGSAARFDWRDVRPLPPEDAVFEKVWQAYREAAEKEAE